MIKHRLLLSPQAPAEDRTDVEEPTPTKEHQKPELSDWEDEGGSLREPPPSPRNPLDLAGRRVFIKKHTANLET